MIGNYPLAGRLTQVASHSGRSNGPERVNAPPQVNPFAKAQREAKPEKQAELVFTARDYLPMGLFSR